MLKKNDLVDVVSLGTACTFEEIEKIENFINKIGLKPRVIFEAGLTLKKPATHEFPSFSHLTRFQQFKHCALSKDSKIIWCTRGGYGSAEILPFLRTLEKPQQKKIFIGFSDISSLNNFLIEEWDWQVISAPMLAQIVLNKVSKKSEKAILNLIFGKTTQLEYQLNSIIALNPVFIPKKEITAIVTGGCLSVLASQFGTQDQINWQNKILFLEDEGEDGERLDRYFNQLTQIISEQKKYPKAILLGNFLEANPHGTPKAKNIKMAIKLLAEKLSEKNLAIPLFEEKTKCLGHSKNMLPLVLGAEARITPAGDFIQRVTLFAKE